jgi:hypothetical protein
MGGGKEVAWDPLLGRGRLTATPVPKAKALPGNKLCNAPSTPGGGEGSSRPSRSLTSCPGQSSSQGLRSSPHRGGPSFGVQFA